MSTLYTAEQVCERQLLPFKPRTLKEMARRGELGHVRIGRKYRFREEDIAAAVAAGTVPVRGRESEKPSRNPRYASR